MPERLLLHCCCAPCASSVLEGLMPSFDVTVLFYNPNIQPRTEYDKRREELNRLLRFAQYADVGTAACEYDRDAFETVCGALYDAPEGGLRCVECFKLRLGKTAELAANGGYDRFTTTLSVSPHKNAQLLNELGGAFAQQYGTEYLHADFKKRDGFKRSIELSKQFGLYRQSYCGCLASSSP